MHTITSMCKRKKYSSSICVAKTYLDFLLQTHILNKSKHIQLSPCIDHYLMSFTVILYLIYAEKIRHASVDTTYYDLELLLGHFH